jgi:hypothetical protein
MIALYSLALLVSAALLFLLEPMVGKFVLPQLGSAPEGWPTTMLFFHAALLTGYKFAHLTSRLNARKQAPLQLALPAVAAVVLPIGVPDANPPQSDSPMPWLLGLLGLLAGLLGGRDARPGERERPHPSSRRACPSSRRGGPDLPAAAPARVLNAGAAWCPV